MKQAKKVRNPYEIPPPQQKLNKTFRSRGPRPYIPLADQFAGLEFDVPKSDVDSLKPYKRTI